MTRHRLTGLSLAALLGGAAMMQSATVSAADLQFRLSVESTPGAPSQVFLAAFRDALQEELGERVAIDYFDSGALGDEIVHLDMVRAGQVDVIPIGSDAVQLDPKWAIFDMPFLFPDRENAARVLDGEIGAELAESMRASANLEVLGLGENGFRNITNNVRPIVTPEDLEGITLRVPGSRTRIMAFQELGATPVEMNLGELYLALQQGVVDGQENPLANVDAWSFYEVQDYVSLSRHVYTPLTLAMNGRKWDSLSEDDQAAVMRAAERAVARSREYSAEMDERVLVKLEGLVEINEIDVAAFQARSGPIWDEIATVAGEDFTRRVIAASGG